MLKAIQMLNSSSGFVSQRLKLNGNCGFSFVSSPCFLKQIPFSAFSKKGLSLRSFGLRLSCSHSGSNPVSSSVSTIQSSLIRKKELSLRSFGLRLCCSHSGSNPELSMSSSVSTIQSSGIARRIKFCQLCGGPTKHEIPDGEEKMRAICTLCGRIAYENPKMVVGCLIEHDNKILLCKRNIQPSFGLWTLPAGYMEIGESAAEGAMRETNEEAGADVEVLSPFAHLDIPLIGQTYIIFLARMKRPHFAPGPESSECRLFSFDEIPFDSLAFSSMLVTLKLYIEDRNAGRSKFHYGTINKRPGTSPSDIHAYTLDDHLHSEKTW